MTVTTLHGAEAAVALDDGEFSLLLELAERWLEGVELDERLAARVDEVPGEILAGIVEQRELAAGLLLKLRRAAGIIVP